MPIVLFPNKLVPSVYLSTHADTYLAVNSIDPTHRFIIEKMLYIEQYWGRNNLLTETWIHFLVLFLLYFKQSNSATWFEQKYVLKTALFVIP